MIDLTKKKYKKSKRQSGGGWMQRFASKKKGLKGFTGKKKWYKPSNHRQFTLDKGDFKTRMKFKGNKMKIVSRTPGGKKTYETYNIDPSDPDFADLKQIKDPKELKNKLRGISDKLANKEKVGSLTKVGEGTYGNKSLLTRRRGKLSAKKIDKDGKILTHTSRAGKLKSKSKFKYDKNGKLLSVDKSIKDKSKLGSTFGRGDTRVSHKYKVNKKGNSIINSTSVKSGKLGRKSTTEYQTNNTGEIIGWKKKKLLRRTKITSRANLIKHEQELNKYGITNDEITGANVDDISKKLKQSGDFSYMSDKELKLKAKGMIATNKKIAKMKDPNAIVKAKLNKKYKGKTDEVNRLQASNNEARRKMEELNTLNPVQVTPTAPATAPAITQTTPAITQTTPAITATKPDITPTKPAITATTPATATKPDITPTKPSITSTTEAAAQSRKQRLDLLHERRKARKILSVQKVPEKQSTLFVPGNENQVTVALTA
jgi:hypothetical protein